MINNHGPDLHKDRANCVCFDFLFFHEFTLKDTSESGQFRIFKTCLKFCNFPSAERP